MISVKTSSVFVVLDWGFISVDKWFVLSGGQVLQITRVQREDAGKYTCQAVNEAGEDRMHFELEILGKQVHIIKMNVKKPIWK